MISVDFHSIGNQLNPNSQRQQNSMANCRFNRCNDRYDKADRFLFVCNLFVLSFIVFDEKTCHAQ